MNSSEKNQLLIRIRVQICSISRLENPGIKAPAIGYLDVWVRLPNYLSTISQRHQCITLDACWQRLLTFALERMCSLNLKNF